MKTINLNKALGLRPLDRVQVNDAHEIREMLLAPQLGYGHLELPFLYFQRTLDDGRLEVRSPGGYCTAVSPLDICDIVPGQPILVRAMPRTAFLSRLKLTYQERDIPIGPECYAEAHVLYVVKDKWGRIDQTFVWFMDESLNGEKPWCAPIHPSDKVQLDGIRRTSMPVLGKGGSYTADHGLAHDRDLNRAIAEGFIRCARKGNRTGREILQMAGVKKISRAMLNRIC